MRRLFLYERTQVSDDVVRRPIGRIKEVEVKVGRQPSPQLIQLLPLPRDPRNRVLTYSVPVYDDRVVVRLLRAPGLVLDPDVEVVAVTLVDELAIDIVFVEQGVSVVNQEALLAAAQNNRKYDGEDDAGDEKELERPAEHDDDGDVDGGQDEDAEKLQDVQQGGIAEDEDLRMDLREWVVGIVRETILEDPLGVVEQLQKVDHLLLNSVYPANHMGIPWNFVGGAKFV